MRSIDLVYDVPADPDTVFASLTDFEHLRRWRSLQSLRLEPDGPARVGTRLFSSVAGPGQTMHFTNEIADLDPARRFYRDRFLDGSFPIWSSWQVEPDGGGARIRWHTEYEGRGPMRLFGPLLGWLIRRGQIQDLARFRQLLRDR